MSIALKPYWRLLGLQCLLTGLVAGGSELFANRPAALAILLGGMIGCVTNLIFMLVCFSIPGYAQKIKKILTAFYVAEGIKLLLTAVLFAIVVLYINVPFLLMFVSYFALYISFSYIGLFLV